MHFNSHTTSSHHYELYEFVDIFNANLQSSVNCHSCLVTNLDEI